jgi:hypothetical protein
LLPDRLLAELLLTLPQFFGRSVSTTFRRIAFADRADDVPQRTIKGVVCPDHQQQIQRSARGSM